MDILGTINNLRNIRNIKRNEICQLLNLYIPNNETSSPPENITTCTYIIPVSEVYRYSNSVSFMVCLFLSFFIVRKFLCVNKLWGRPGLLYPMNTLEMRHTVLCNCTAFSILSNLVYSIISGEGHNPFNFDPGTGAQQTSLNILIKIFSVLVYGGSMYPLFACISVGSAVSYLVGSIFIWLYSTVMTLGLFYIQNCDTTEFIASIVFRNIFFLLSLLILCVYMPYFTVVQFKRGNYFQNHFKKDCSHLHYTSKRISFISSTAVRSLKGKIKSLKNVKKGSFRYPPAFFCSLCIAFVVTYMFAYISLTFFIGSIDPIKRLIDECVRPHDSNRSIAEVFVDVISPPNRTMLESYYWNTLNVPRLLSYYIWVFKISVIAGEILALLLVIGQFPFIITSFKRHMKAVYRNDITEIRSKENTGQPVSLIIAFTRYTGYQVAHLCWAYIIQSFILVTFLFLLSCVVIIPILHGFGQFWIELILKMWPIPIFTFVILLAQNLLARFLFLEERGKYLVVDNRRLFFIYSYFMFFYNIFLGFFSTLRRILLNAALGILFIGRLDFSLMAKKFEKMDGGHTAYCGFLHVHNAHCNPHLLTFLHLLKKEEVDDEGDNNNEKPTTTKVNDIVSRRARNNWQMFYTLTCNPSLQLYRKHRLDAIEERKIRKNNQINNNQSFVVTHF